MLSTPLFILALAAASLAAVIDYPLRRHTLGRGGQLAFRAQSLTGTGQYLPYEPCPGDIVDSGTMYGARFRVYYSDKDGGTGCMVLDNVSGRPLQMLASIFSDDGRDYAADGGMPGHFPVNGYAGSLRITDVGTECWSWGIVIGNQASQTYTGQHCPTKE